MEIWLTVLGGVFGIIGAFAGAWLANRYERRSQKLQERRDTTMNLYVEFQNPDMLHARILARVVFERNKKRQNPLSLNQMREKLKTEEWHAVSVGITFFEKLGVFLKNDYLDTKLARSLFEHDFRWWYDKYIEKFVKDDKLEATWSQAIEHINLWTTKEKKRLK
jgi:hypothetical protein